MLIEKVHIEKFRGFHNVEFNVGSQITVISGLNGTQKTTLLGILSQPFSLRKDKEMNKEKPLCGGNYISSFAEKFKLSKKYDKAGEHEWTLYFDDPEQPEFTIESINRDKREEEKGIRFWKKGNRGKGSGYIQMPVIYLSLKRLFPIGEDDKINESKSIELTKEELDDFKENHKKILISMDSIEATEYLESKNKHTLGINTSYYDWRQNSAGQDNVSKILLALLSFERLQKKYKNNYKGGLLVIDEIDATMYPAAQIKLLHVLRKKASKLQIQVVFTTHSLSLLKEACDLQNECLAKEETKNQVNIIYLKKKDNEISIINSVPYTNIENRLNVTISNQTNIKIQVYREDKETEIFIRNLLHNTKILSNLKFIPISLSCTNLLVLVHEKVPCFIFPNSIIVVDGDIKNDRHLRNIQKKASNVIVLPTKQSPERMLADFLYKLEEKDELWEKIDPDYGKNVCFKNHSIEKIKKDRDNAKEWFNEQKSTRKEWARLVINKWKENNDEECKNFIDNFKETYNKFANELNITTIK